MSSRVTAVCVVHEVRPGWYHDTAIDKRPASGRVAVGPLGLDGDTQIDSSHGGPDAAVYVYADEDAAHFAEVLGREVPAGFFGENLRVSGLDVTGAQIGERWRVGEVELEVRKPRTPCKNLAQRVGVDGFHLDFNATGRVGAMCRVVREGSVGAGDEVEVLDRPAHDVTVADLATGLTGPQAAALLDSGVALADKVRAKARRVRARASTGDD
ncbi:MOSC domain-containing protein [Nocardioides sp. HDW12B]|uniref:MOSC domain-containing protein n=1 Tax=Nocardioides sp. HDW12B TaxID=2714939 RepID=UPI00140C9876|nr:MOSC domain-containing protein [Nocardioides sp. HDW12B]QIK66297.1 MOSC domain-containing protein [Nocardioides sp. HDW12B]